MCLSRMPRKNHILAALPDEEYMRLLPHLELVSMPSESLIFEAGRPVSWLHFPIDCIVSLFITLENGATTEFAVVGNEGMLGVNLLMGCDRMPYLAMVQNEGYGYRVKAHVAQKEFALGGELQRISLQYMQARMTQIAQLALCNRHHHIEQQFCRWLLSSLDRLQGKELTMTHERIAQTLGVRREGVSSAAGKLQAEGLIEYHRGHISVLDRPALEERACECYSVVKKAFDNLLPNDCDTLPSLPKHFGAYSAHIKRTEAALRLRVPADHQLAV
jgi:CRP-like cAMP-binding protein